MEIERYKKERHNIKKCEFQELPWFEKEERGDMRKIERPFDDNLYLSDSVPQSLPEFRAFHFCYRPYTL